MNQIIEILCRRDGISVREAVQRVREVQDLMAQSNYDYDECEDILSTHLGLEMDYIHDLI